ncbi:hypothetical protein ACFQH6_04565 [Halobacteriaceae archaeon GCM10025711]
MTHHNSISRRNVLRTTAALPILGSGIIAGSANGAAQSSEPRLIVEQNGKQIPVTPLSYNEQRVEDFYNYGYPDGASANTPTDLEKRNTSRIFFYSGPRGISLVFIHDAPNDGSGGQTVMHFDTLPSEGRWILPDDPGETYTRTQARWGWAPCCTDGGVYHGGFDSNVAPVQITPDFNHGIDTWELLSGNAENPTVTELSRSSPVTIRVGETEDSFSGLVSQKERLAASIDANSHGYIDDTGMVSPVLTTLADQVDSGSLGETEATDIVERLHSGERLTDATLAGAGSGSSRYLSIDTNLSQLTAEAAINPVIELLFAGISVVKVARQIPFVGGAAKRAARALADIAADIAGMVNKTLERMIRKRGEEAGFAMLSKAESEAKEAGRPIAEEEFNKIRDEESLLLVEDSRDVIFHDYLFNDKYDYVGNPTKPLDESVEDLVDASDPKQTPNFEGDQERATSIADSGLDLIEATYQEATESIEALNFGIKSLGLLSGVTALIALGRVSRGLEPLPQSSLA